MKQSKSEFSSLIYIVSLAGLALALGIATVVPGYRQQIREQFLSFDRQILAKTEGDLSGKGDFFVVVKVKTPDSLSLELYSRQSSSGDIVFQKRLVLPEKRDGYFNYHGQEANLILADVDHDGALEILAPTFDDNLIPRLNVYKYSIESQSFERLGPDSIQL